MYMETSHLLKKLSLQDKINTNLLDINDYKKNKTYFRDSVFSKNTIEHSRSWLIHLLGGGALSRHFISSKGDLYNKKEIEKEIYKILSWRGTEMNDTWLYQKLNKKISYSYYYFVYYFSYLKKIMVFLETLFGSLTLNENAMKNSIHILSIPALSGFSCLASLYNNRDNINKESIKNIGKNIFIGHILLNILFSIYSTYYFELEQKHLIETLNKGIGSDNITEINKYRELLYGFEEEVLSVVSLKNHEVLELLHKHYSYFFNFNDKNLKNVLSNALKSHTIIFSSFYKDIIHTNEIIPLAIFFFNQDGHLRTIREMVCCIIYSIKKSSSTMMKYLKTSSVIKKSRQINLSKRVKKNRNKITKKNIHKL